MKRAYLICFASFLTILVLQAAAGAQPTGRVLPPVTSAFEVQGKEDPKQKDKDKDKKAEPPQTDVFARIQVPRTEAPAGYNPHMLGDHGTNKFARINANFIGTQTVKTTVVVSAIATTTTVTTPASLNRAILVPIPHQGAYKVAENASPRPQDRVFGYYNYYNDVRAPRDFAQPFTQVSVLGPIAIGAPGDSRTVTTTTTVAGAARFQDLHRETFGFEKTFFDGNASIELRMPIMQQLGGGDESYYSHQGDLTIVTKYALINNLDTGNVLSGGLAITAPTSPSIHTVEGDVRSVLLQPWFGYIVNRDRWFVQGFHSVVVPTDSRDVTLMFNDIGVNYWLYRGERDGLLRFIVPTAEAHITTPLNRRNIDTDPIVVTDAVVLTGGVHFGFGRGSTLTVGAGAPITGPRPYSFEAYLQYNWRY